MSKSTEPERKLPFSQRTGLAPIPPQLKLAEVSDGLRRLLWFAIYQDLKQCVRTGARKSWVERRWEDILLELHVRFFEQMPDEYDESPNVQAGKLKQFILHVEFGGLFDLLEFLLGQPSASQLMKKGIADAFIEARAAYRVFGGSEIGAVGTEEQAAAIERAVNDAERASAVGAREHLINASKALRSGDWSGGVRESIHAVEAVAVQLAPGSKELGSALGALEKDVYLHAALKAAFKRLYGYSSDEKGVRHSLVFDDEAKVDEADALFMLGACTSFVSFLTAKGNSAGLLSQDE